MQLKHEIEVNCPACEAFYFCSQVENWSTYFAPCLKSEVVEQEGNQQQIRLTAWGNDRLFCWQSIRTLDDQKLEITFQQAKPMPLVNNMKGKWCFIALTDDTCCVELWHEFSIKENISGLVEGVNSTVDAEQFMQKTIDANSDRELLAIKKCLEQQTWHHEFAEELVVKGDKDIIFQLLREAEYWPALLPHCTQVDMEYNDGEHQIFTMTVQVNGGDEVIRTIRRCADHAVTYFQPTPPLPLKKHVGSWTLEDTTTGVKINSWHDVVLNPEHWQALNKTPAEAKQLVAQAINNNSLGTMHAIQQKLAELSA
ncbi:SRPBCC family protein [Zooshikella harenae]|uniref:Coenzyme Q-binding protein COQ10 START domain-containing protein n=1 Tax=Zooshikella harenae TaxID=2827238 RepID=A0ABS5ZJL6_9GAMM|nr:SRPBCC family protein [Zooshikella harenae]MBU2713431.1 hypothetical protein [Zooshikella harenae]